MLLLFANSKILFAINYFTLSIIYHVPGMINHVLSEPCVYLSPHYRNVHGVAQSKRLWYGRTKSRATPSWCSFSTARTVTHKGLVVGGWRRRDKTYFDNASLIDSVSFQVSCRFPDLVMSVRIAFQMDMANIVFRI